MSPASEPESVSSASGVSETVACPPSPVAGDASALPSPLLYLQSVTLLARSLDTSPCIQAVVLYYRAFQGIIFMYYLCG